MKKPLALIIMDGFGMNPDKYGNAIAAARTPRLQDLFSKHPFTTLAASGLDVGLPDGQMGNSEVGHTNMGAGRVVYQELTRISKSIRDGDFFENPALLAAMQNAKKDGAALHLAGLLSDGGVHSHMEHVYGLLDMAQKNGVKNVFVHAFLDGRDVAPSSGKHFVEQLQAKMTALGVGRLATVIGRYYAMDRDNRWERVEKAYAAMVYGEGISCNDPVAGVAASYAEKVTDEFVLPLVCAPDGNIKAGDSVVFFNFRPDRAREITRTLVDPAFDGFPRKKGCFPLHYVCLTQYDKTMPGVQVAFHPQSLRNTLGEYISDAGLTQLRIAETEKYAHVTFFFNGGVEKEYPGEDRVLIPSPKVATYDLQPEMSAPPVCDAVVERIRAGAYDVIVLNYANCDMVGHTGVFDAAKAAVETVDACVGKTVDAILAMGGTALITADHGNADKMYAENGSPFTAHTTYPVPLCMVGQTGTLRDGGRLADIAPTMLKILGLPQPEEMDGRSLLD